jgi:uncharacterized protein
MAARRYGKSILLATLFLVLILSAGPVLAQGGYPTRTDSTVNDFAALLTTEQAAALRSLLSRLKTDTGIEAVVVTVDSIRDYATGDASILSFATQLFNTWELGDAQKNDGVLILVAWKDREVRIEVGSGYGRSLDADLQTIINEQMIPSFRREDYSQGIYDGAQAVSRRLYAYSGKTPAAGSAAAVGTAPQTQSDSVNVLPFMIVFVVGAAASAFGAERYARYHKRRCPNCQTYMTRLDEVADDVFLDSGQKVEELLQSVDYDVWKCPSCNYHALQRYNRALAKIGQCPQCNYRTVQTDSRTISEPTYESSGTKLITQDCRHCHYHDEEKVILPMLTRIIDTEDTDWNIFSSSSNTGDSDHSSHYHTSRSSRSSSHASSSHSSSSSRSSSGGRSSGGGASGKW